MPSAERMDTSKEPLSEVREMATHFRKWKISGKSPQPRDVLKRYLSLQEGVKDKMLAALVVVIN